MNEGTGDVRRARTRVTSTRVLNVVALLLVALAVGAIATKNARGSAAVRLVNVSYDPTRELYARIDPLFTERYARETGTRVAITTLHGGSSRQARAVVTGQAVAQVVTLGLVSDVESLHKRGLLGDGWAARLPNGSQPYTSTIVFVVRRGNPKAVTDWPDLVKPGVEIITPDPMTSGNGKLSAIAAWGATVLRGGTDEDATAFLRSLYEHAPFLETGARAAALAFAVEKLGDVHLAWENEAIREVAEAKGALEIVYPPLSILAEPAVAWVDANVNDAATAAAAKAYLGFLFTDEGQEIVAQSGYRPWNRAILEKHADRFPRANLFAITAIAQSWDDAHHKFFDESGIVERVYRPKPR